MDKCSVCGGKLEYRFVTYLKEHENGLVAVGNVPAQVCQRCGEEYFSPEVVDELHRIIEEGRWTQTLEVPYTQMKTSS